VPFLDLFLPARCAACGRGEALLCDGCSGALVFIRPPLCARCGAPVAWPVERCAECAGRRIAFATARTAVAYDGPARALVAAWKERGLRALVTDVAALVHAAVPPPAADALVPIPGDRDRSLWRGHNTAEALARALALEWALPVMPLLRRARPVPRQRGLSRAARRANVRESFAASGRAPARVVVVDDVYTTGATASAAAAELRRAGARRVDVVTFARAVRR
jgi:predicted amidophosphoribosyltransferase